MSAQQVLLIAGIVALVAAVVFAALAVWTYRVLDIRGVRADLNGTARAREAAAAPAGGPRRTSARAFSSATWHGTVTKKGEPAPTEHVPRPVASPPPAPPGRPATAGPPRGGDEPTSLIASAGGSDEPTSLVTSEPAADEPTTVVDPSFEFHVVIRESGAASSQRIEG